MPDPVFATVINMELVLQQTIPAEKVAAAEYALLTVSAGIRNYCQQVLDLVTDDEVLLDSPGRGLILLPELPVVDVTAVVENSVALMSPGDYELGRAGVLYRVGRRWHPGRQVVAVTYSHGWAVIPDDIATTCARAASRLYQAGLRAEESSGVPGVVSKSLGDFSVTYGGDSVIEGALGASGARVLLLSEKDTLDHYRIKP